jgi:hypothetical protein
MAVMNKGNRHIMTHGDPRGVCMGNFDYQYTELDVLQHHANSKKKGILGQIFVKSQNKIQDPASCIS